MFRRVAFGINYCWMCNTAHGGLFRSVSVPSSKRSKGKKRRRMSLNPEANGLSLDSLEELFKARRSVLDPPWEDLNLIPGDVLWSDPSMNSGLSPNDERGIGLLRGPDIAEEFLKEFDLKATEERYKDKGAYIVLEHPNFDVPIIHSFEAITPQPKEGRR